MSWQELCKIEDLKNVGWKSCLVGKMPIFAVWRDGNPRAFYDQCSHQAVTLTDFGEIQGDSILCNAHGALFSLEDGAVQKEPACKALTRYPVKVSDKWLLINLDPSRVDAQ